MYLRTADVRAITQRWGRLNRLGDKPHARRAVSPNRRRTRTDLRRRPITTLGEAPLQAVAYQSRSGSDPCRAGKPDDPPPDVPELLPFHLWEFAKTSFPPPDHAPPELFFSGFDDDLARVSVGWRTELPALGSELFPSTATGELVDVSVWELRTALESREFIRIASDGVNVEHVARARCVPATVS